jgi:hypothetical protein
MTPSYAIGSWDDEMGLCDGGKSASHGHHGKGSCLCRIYS